MQVEVISDDFLIGSSLVPRGSVLSLPECAVSYMEKAGSGRRVPPETVSGDVVGYVRQDMQPEKQGVVNPVVNDTLGSKPRRAYKRRTKG